MAGTHALQARATEAYLARKQVYERDLEHWNASKSDRGERPTAPHQTAYYVTDTTMEDSGILTGYEYQTTIDQTVAAD